MSYLAKVLSDKLPDSTEIELHLFEFCNLNCSFCGQDHNSKKGMNREDFDIKADTVIEFMRNNENNEHIINLMGGELFNDEVPDFIFDNYRFFYDKINKWAISAKQTVRFNWVTNLIFSKSKRVLELLDSQENSFISTSYDFSGRGLDINRKLLFNHNLKLMGDRINVIGFVMTRPAIRKLLSDKDSLFKELYDNYTLYFDYYVPEKSADKLLPSDDELLEAYLFIADNYPKVFPINDWLNKEKNKLTCYSLNKLTMLPSNEIVKCRYLEYDEGDFINEVDYGSNENIIESFIETNGCMSCEWYDRCTMRCFVQFDWKKFDKSEECILRTFFNEKVKLGTNVN